MSRFAFIGTCRVLDPARHLRREMNLPALPTAHRVHSPAEIERLVRILAGGEIDPKTVHTLSDAAFSDLLNHPAGIGWTIEFLEKLHAIWDGCKAFIIEISTLKQSFVETPQGRLYVNHYTARDLGLFSDRIEPMIHDGALAPIRHQDVQSETARDEDVLATMARVKDLVGGRPIIWACHLNVAAQSDHTQRLREVRSRIARVTALGASRLGDRFYDPTEIVVELGERRALQKGGTDYNHFTPNAIRMLADRYWKMASG